MSIDASLTYSITIQPSKFHLSISLPAGMLFSKNLKSFWSLCWVHIAHEDGKGNIGFPRAYKSRFVGCDLFRTLEPCFKVIGILSTGKISTSKDVIFDNDNNYKNADEYPSDLDFAHDISAVLTPTEVV